MAYHPHHKYNLIPLLRSTLIMKTEKRRFSGNNTNSTELCTRTAKRKRVRERVDTTTSHEVCTNTSKRKRADTTSSAVEVCSNTSKRKRADTTSSAVEVCSNTSKRKRADTTSSPEVCDTSATLTSKWSDLQPELLDLIFEKLPAKEAIRFPVVCHSWEHAAKSFVSSKKYRPLSQQPPMLIIPNKDMSGRLFFSSADKKVHNIANDFPVDEIVLSSYGWLLMCRQYNEDTMVIYLFNPFSGARIVLPPITDHNQPPVRRAAISADPSRNNNFIVIIYLKKFEHNRMMFFKHGGDTTEWKDLRWFHGLYPFQVDLVLYKDKLYVITSDHIVVWDFDPTKTEDFPTKTKDLHIQGLTIERHLVVYTHSVESQGDILFVKKVERGSSYKFYVYRLDLDGEKWEELKSLIDRALFFHEKLPTMALSTRNFPAILKGNSIYCVEIYKKPKKKSDEIIIIEAELSIVQYNLEDKKKRKVYEKFKAKRPGSYEKFPQCPWILPDPILHCQKKHKSTKTEVD